MIGARPILVDTGSQGDAARIVTGCAAAGVSIHDITLVLHTRVHSDHFGKPRNWRPRPAPWCITRHHGVLAPNHPLRRAVAALAIGNAVHLPDSRPSVIPKAAASRWRRRPSRPVDHVHAAPEALKCVPAPAVRRV